MSSNPSSSPARTVAYAVVGALHLAATAAVWRDLHRRPPEQVRGPKLLWRIASALNTGNALLYVIVGRRR